MTSATLNLSPVLDLARYFDSTGPDGQGRSLLARQIVEFAAQCRSNAELLDGLHLALDPAYGFEPMQLLGQGSTRRVWKLPFQMVLKLERHDDLSTEEMGYRGSRKYLDMRRSAATFNELLTSMSFPALGPRIYGALLAFGIPRFNPAILISERADLRERRRADRVSVDDLFICGKAGHLLITDRLMNPDAPAASPSDRPYRKQFIGGDETLHFSNFGRVDGRWVLLDMGNFDSAAQFEHIKTLMPAEVKHGWDTPEKALRISLWMQGIYEGRRTFLMDGGNAPDTGGYGDE